MTLNWTAGFNGGLEQTFTLCYKAEGTNEEHEATVKSDTDVNVGDIVIYKLKNRTTVTPNTTYYVRVRAGNSFEGGSTVYGESAKLSTLCMLKIIHFTYTNKAVIIHIFVTIHGTSLF